MPRKDTNLAFAYYRYNDTTKGQPDNFPSQKRLCQAFAAKNKLKIVGRYVDGVTLGEGFDYMLAEISKRDDIKVVIIAEATTLARSPIEREAALLALKKRGVSVVTAAGDDLSNDPAREEMRKAAVIFARNEAIDAHVSAVVGTMRKVRAGLRAAAQEYTMAREKRRLAQAA